MTVSQHHALRLAALIRDLRRRFPRAAAAAFESTGQAGMASAASSPSAPIADIAGADPIDEMIISFLTWEASSARARAGLARLRERVVDYNDLRVCLPDEIADMLGAEYPLARDRSERLKSALYDVYQREHSMSLARLTGMAAREARAYLDTLAGMAPYVSARVVLRRFGAHAVPVDGQLQAMLTKAECVDPATDLESCQSWLEHHIRAADAGAVHSMFQAWVDATVDPRPASKRRSRRGNAATERSHRRAPRSRDVEDRTSD